MIQPDYEKILKEKTDYYGQTLAAHHFAADEYARQWHTYISEIADNKKETVSVIRICDNLIERIIKNNESEGAK